MHAISPFRRLISLMLLIAGIYGTGAHLSKLMEVGPGYHAYATAFFVAVIFYSRPRGG